VARPPFFLTVSCLCEIHQTQLYFSLFHLFGRASVFSDPEVFAAHPDYSQTFFLPRQTLLSHPAKTPPFFFAFSKGSLLPQTSFLQPSLREVRRCLVLSFLDPGTRPRVAFLIAHLLSIHRPVRVCPTQQGSNLFTRGPLQ